MSTSVSARAIRRLERGSTLIVAIVLLLLLTLVGLFAVNVGLSEQRASGSEFRGRIVRQVAEAALSQTFEYLRMSRLVPTEPQGEVDLTVWQPCTAADTTFPCGVVPQSVMRDADDDGAEDDVAPFRAATYRFIRAGGYDMNGNGSIDNLERYMIPLPNLAGTTNPLAIQQVGNFPVRVGVGAVLCTLDERRQCVGSAGTDESRSGLATVTLVAVAEIPGENARATITQSYGSFNILATPPSAPPLVSGGIMQGVGNSTIVSNPDSGGVGVPVSIWNRGPMDVNNGSWQTCQLDEFMRSGTPGQSESGVLICEDCDCLTSQKDSKGQGAGGPRIGLDIQSPRLGANNNDDYWDGPDDTPGTSDDTVPSQFFPCDLFDFVFGVKARINDENNDGIHDDDGGDGIADAENGLPYGICESGIDEDNDGQLDNVVDYLESIEATELTSCDTLDELSADPDWEGGVFWIKDNQCTLANQVGTPDIPIVIVAEKGFKLTNATVFGVLFGLNHKLIDLDEGNLASYEPTFEPGGGKSQVYGSFIVEGGGKVNGTIDLIASPKVIENINNGTNARRFGNVPSSWSDRFSF